MYKISALITVVVLTGLGIPFGIMAEGGRASFVFGSSVDSATNGDKFNLPIFVKSGGEKLDTIRLSLSFPPDKLEVVNFSLVNMFPNLSPGGFIDNQKGWLYQGGYRINGPTMESGLVGVVTFLAKASGRVRVAINNDSLLLGTGQVKNSPLAPRELKFAIKEPLFNAVYASSQTLDSAGKPVFEVSSDSHPDFSHWYSKSKVNIELKVFSSDVERFYFTLDNNPLTDPVKPLPSEELDAGRLLFENISDGVWYLHLKARSQGGKDIGIVHYGVRIDTTPPNVVAPYLDKEEVFLDGAALLNFGTVDQLSGVSKYMVSVGSLNLGSQTSPMLISGLKPGEHMVRVVAYDLAGNVSEGGIKLTVVKPAGGFLERPAVIFFIGLFGLVLAGVLVNNYFSVSHQRRIN